MINVPSLVDGSPRTKFTSHFHSTASLERSPASSGTVRSREFEIVERATQVRRGTARLFLSFSDAFISVSLDDSRGQNQAALHTFPPSTLAYWGTVEILFFLSEIFPFELALVNHPCTRVLSDLHRGDWFLRALPSCFELSVVWPGGVETRSSGLVVSCKETTTSLNR